MCRAVETRAGAVLEAVEARGDRDDVRMVAGRVIDLGDVCAEEPVLGVSRPLGYPGELSRSLGLGAGGGARSRLAATLERLVNFGLARPASDGDGLAVYRQVPPLTQRQLARLPEWTRDAEDRLLGTHLTQIDDSTRHHANVVSITARLDRLQHRDDPRLDDPTRHGPSIA